MNRWKASLCALGLVISAGCGAEDPSDESADDSEVASLSQEVVTTTYFAARPDLRRCAAPLCGGSFVRALNRDVTTCFDGSRASECYVAKIDLAALGLSDQAGEQLIREQRKVVFAGQIARGPEFAGRRLGRLVAQKAFRGVNELAPDAVLLTKKVDFVCIKAPCPTHVGEAVNRGTRFDITRLELRTLQASERDRARVRDALAGEGALLSGQLELTREDVGFTVRQAYLRVAPQACGSRGLPSCSKGEYCAFANQECGELDRPGICKPRPTQCILLYRPVCGCDGRTYGNDCQAAAAGASVDHLGACEQSEEEVSCGGIIGKRCPGAGTCEIDTPCKPGSPGCPVCSDCTGTCSCSGAAVLCGPGTFFDDSPSVCSCVPHR